MPGGEEVQKGEEGAKEDSGESSQVAMLALIRMLIEGQKREALEIEKDREEGRKKIEQWEHEKKEREKQWEHKKKEMDIQFELEKRKMQFEAEEYQKQLETEVERIEELSCYDCGRLGHIAAECWDAKNSSEEVERERNEELICLDCDREGHIAEECRDTKNISKGVAPGSIDGATKNGSNVVNGEVNSQKTSIFLETLANISIVPESMVKPEDLTGETVEVKDFRDQITELPMAEVSFKIFDSEWVEKVAVAPLENGKECKVIYSLDLGSTRGLDLVFTIKKIKMERVNRIGIIAEPRKETEETVVLLDEQNEPLVENNIVIEQEMKLIEEVAVPVTEEVAVPVTEEVAVPVVRKMNIVLEDELECLGGLDEADEKKNLCLWLDSSDYEKEEDVMVEHDVLVENKDLVLRKVYFIDSEVKPDIVERQEEFISENRHVKVKKNRGDQAVKKKKKKYGKRETIMKSLCEGEMILGRMPEIEFWQDPYKVVARVNPVDYKIEMKEGKTEILQRQDIKKYYEQKKEIIMSFSFMAEEEEKDELVGLILDGNEIKKEEPPVVTARIDRDIAGKQIEETEKKPPDIFYELGDLPDVAAEEIRSEMKLDLNYFLVTSIWILLAILLSYSSILSSNVVVWIGRMETYTHFKVSVIGHVYFMYFIFRVRTICRRCCFWILDFHFSIWTMMNYFRHWMAQKIKILKPAEGGCSFFQLGEMWGSTHRRNRRNINIMHNSY